MIRPVVELVAKFVDEITDPLRGTSQGVKGIAADMEQGFTESMQKMGAAVVGFFGVYKMVEFFKASVEAASKERVSLGELRNALDNTGGSYAQFGAAAEAAITSTSKFSNFADSELRKALALLVQNTGDASGSIANMGLITDIASARAVDGAGRQNDLATAVKLVSFAVEGNATQLKRYGITVLAGQDAIAVLNERFGGAAQAARDADGGIAHLATTWEEFKEVVGKGTVSLGNAKDGTEKLSDALGFLGPKLGAIGGYIVTGFVDSLNYIRHFGTSIWNWLTLIADLSSGNLTKFRADYAAQLAALDADTRKMTKDTEDELRGLEGGSTTILVKGLDGRKRLRKADWDAQLAEAEKEGGALVTEDAKLRAKLLAAVQKLAHDRSAFEVTTAAGDRSASQQNWQALLADETAVGEARTALLTAEAKRAGKISDAKEKRDEDEWTAGVLVMGAAYEKRLAAGKRVDEAERKASEEFVREFGTELPKASQELQKKIDDLTHTIGELRTANKTAYREEYDHNVATIAVMEERLGAYKHVQGVLNLIAGLHATITAQELNPDVPVRLETINTQLAFARALLQDQTLSQSARQEIEAEINRLLRERNGVLTKNVEHVKQEAAHTKKIADEVGRGAYEALRFAERAGLISSSMAQVLTTAIGIGQTLAGGNPVGAIAGFAGILVSLFGESPENAARKALLQKNSLALIELAAINNKLVLQGDTGAAISGFQALGADQSMYYGGPYGGFTAAQDASGSDFSIAKLSAILRPLGLTVAEMRTIAGELGIDLGEKNGKFSGGGVQAFIAGVESQGPTATAFGGTFQGLIDETTFHETLLGGSGLTLADWKKISANSGSPILQGIFDGLGTTGGAFSSADVTEIRRRIRDIGDHINEQSQMSLGRITTGQLTSTLGTISGLVAPVAPPPPPPPPPTAFGGGFQGTLDRLSFGEGLHGGSLTLQDYADAATGPGNSPFLASLFQGLDLTKPADLATLRSRIKIYGAKLANDRGAITSLGSLSALETVSAFTTISGLAAPVAPPAAPSVGAALYAPPPSGSYAPSSTSGTTWDLSPVVNAILASNAFLVRIADSNDAIAGHTAALAADLTKGGLMVTVLTGAQQAADLTGANTGQRG